MIRPSVRIGLIACLGSGLAVCVAGADEGSVPTPGGSPTDVLVTVGDTPIFRSEFEAVLRRALAAAPQAGAIATGAGAGGGQSRRQWLEAVAMEQLVDQRLLTSEIERERITVGRLDVETRLEQLKKQVAARGLDWQQFLEQTGREETAVREQIEFEISLDKLIRPKLTPAAIDAGYQRHRRELDGTRMRVSHVVLRPDAALGDDGIAATTARAATIRRDIVQGSTTFADAARRHSAGPSRLRGGDLGWITRDAPLIDAFGKQAFALAKGDVSKPFATPFGVHIVQVTDVEPGRATLEVLRPRVEALLAGTVLRETLARLRSSTRIEYGAGVTHFDPATPAGGQEPRRLVVAGGPAPRPVSGGP